MRPDWANKWPNSLPIMIHNSLAQIDFILVASATFGSLLHSIKTKKCGN